MFEAVVKVTKIIILVPALLELVKVITKVVFFRLHFRFLFTITSIIIVAKLGDSTVWRGKGG